MHKPTYRIQRTQNTQAYEHSTIRVIFLFRMRKVSVMRSNEIANVALYICLAHSHSLDTLLRGVVSQPCFIRSNSNVRCNVTVCMSTAVRLVSADWWICGCGQHHLAMRPWPKTWSYFFNGLQAFRALLNWRPIGSVCLYSSHCRWCAMLCSVFFYIIGMADNSAATANATHSQCFFSFEVWLWTMKEKQQ